MWDIVKTRMYDLLCPILRMLFICNFTADGDSYFNIDGFHLSHEEYSGVAAVKDQQNWPAGLRR